MSPHEHLARATPRAEGPRSGPEASQLRQAIGAIGDVIDSVVYADSKSIDAVNAIVMPDADLGHITRAIQAYARSGLGMDVGPQAINLVRATRAGALQRKRWKLDSVTSARMPHRVNADVVLERGKDELVGRAESDTAPDGLRRAAAQAVLNAFREKLGYEITLDSVEKLEIEDDQVVVVTLDSPRHGKLVGSALVRKTEDDASARSTLMGLNRFIATE